MKMLQWNVGMFSVFLALQCVSVPAQARQPGQGEWDVVTGEVVFEARSTIVPMVVCKPGEECPKSVPYWVVVLTRDGVKHEIAQPFAKGQKQIPESVEVSGVVVRPGTRLLVEGLIRAISPRYAIIAEISRVDVLAGGSSTSEN